MISKRYLFVLVWVAVLIVSSFRAFAEEEVVRTVPQPVLMSLSANKDMYASQEAIIVTASLWATKPITLCLYSGHPEANFSVDIYRAGFGKVNTLPQVVQFDRNQLKSITRVKLETGQSHKVSFNLKQLAPLPPTYWKTGDYRVQAKFFLCGDTEQAEQEVPSQGPLHLLVLEK